MKDLFKLSLIFIVVGVILLLSGIAFGNATASAIGIAFAGIGGTITASDAGATARTLAAMWVVLAIIIIVLLGAQGAIPMKISWG